MPRCAFERRREFKRIGGQPVATACDKKSGVLAGDGALGDRATQDWTHFPVCGSGSRRLVRAKRAAELDVQRSPAIESIRSKRGSEAIMDQLIEQSLRAALAREGLEARDGDLEQFSEIIELYANNLKQLHSVDLGAEELAPVFRPEWKPR
jgi:hypothetical protein